MTGLTWSGASWLRWPDPMRRGALLIVGGLVLLGGCSITPPQPWEKGVLALPAMAMDTDPLDARFVQHIYTSKENSAGGQGVGGGGCGCN